MNSRSRGSASESKRPAELASVRAMRIVGTPQTSAANRAATSFTMNSRVGTPTFPPRMAHFMGLIAGNRAERRNVGIRVHQIPQPLRAKPRQRVLNLDRAAQPQHIRVRVRTCDAGPAGTGGPVIERVLLVAVTVTIDPVHS